MKKYLIGLASVAAAAALAIAPGSALAVGTWSGWSTDHPDNLTATSPPYILTFGNNGTGNSDYCAGVPGGAPNSCSGALVTSPVVFTGVLTAGGTNLSCNHDDHQTANDPCTNGDLVGAFYVGPQGGGGVGLQG